MLLHLLQAKQSGFHPFARAIVLQSATKQVAIALNCTKADVFVNSTNYTTNCTYIKVYSVLH